MDLNKKSLPRPKSTTAWKPIPHVYLVYAGIKIPHIEFERTHCVFVLVKTVFDKSMYWDPMCGISILADFRSMGYKLSCSGSLWSK